MPGKSLDEQLKSAIILAKRGERARAREVLRSFLGLYPNSATAWLWLSSVVDTAQEKRECLERALQVNPGLTAAQRGLDILKMGPDKSKIHSDYVVSRKIKPVSPAAAILYPERQVKEWRWRDDVHLNQSPRISYTPRSKFADVWSLDADLCAYCAAEIDEDHKRCPVCDESLYRHRFRYASPSSDQVIYWVLLLGAGQLFFIQSLLDVMLREPAAAVLWHGFLFLLLAGLALGVYLRQFWAYAVSVSILSLMLAFFLIDLATGQVVSSLASGLAGSDYFVAMADGPFITLAAPVLDMVRPFQIITLLLALSFGVLRAGPDFERERIRLVAEVDGKLHGAAHYYMAGKKYAEQGMWAKAVAHWQRAAASDPGQFQYQYQLGLALARLGFHDRGLDVLESASRLAKQDSIKLELGAVIEKLRAAREQRQPGG